MIIVKGRELLIPENERYIGTNYDAGMENRLFRIPRYSQSGTDLSDLTFKINLIFEGDPLDRAEMTKAVDDDYIYLTWIVTEAQVAVTGTVFVCVTGNDTNDTVKWSSFQAPFYTEKSLGDDIDTAYHDLVNKVTKEITDRESAVAAEKSAREAADTTLQQNINAEASARAAGDAAVNTRIDNIVAQSGDDITEIVDARTGADSTVHASLKARLDAENTELKNQLDDTNNSLSEIRTAYGVNLFDPDALIPNTFLDGTTGEATANSNYWATDFILVDGTYTVRAFEYSGAARTRVYMYDSDKVYDHRAVQAPESFPNGYTFTWTGYIRINIDNGNNGPYENPNKYMLVKGSSSSGVADTFIPYYTAYDKTSRENLTKALRDLIVNHTSNYDFTDLNTINDNSIYYTSPSRVTDHYPPNLGAAYIWTVKLNTTNKMQIAFSAYGTSAYIRASVNDSWGAWKEFTMGESSQSYVTKAEAYETSTIALFPSVGCCGDSFTAGYLYNKTDSQWYDPDYVPNGEYPAIGYPAVMGRLYGVDVTAYAKGGLTSTAYRTDAKGLPALLADDPKYLYIIALGLNDKTQNVPLGVEDDIDTEPSTPTYLGNMGAIIRAVKAHAPYARIILCKSLWMNTSYYNYISDGVELLSSHLGIPYIETANDPYFDSSAYKNGLKGLHPTAPLYAGMGKRIGELVGKCVIDNPTYFYNFYVPNT